MFAEVFLYVVPVQSSLVLKTLRYYTLIWLMLECCWTV